MGSKDTEGRLRSSRISLIVKAAFVFCGLANGVLTGYRGEAHLHRSSSADNPYSLHPAFGKRLQCVVRHVGLP